MRARFYDGLTARPRDVDVLLANGELIFEVNGEGRVWRLDRADVERLDGVVRVALPGEPARLQIVAGDWPSAEREKRGGWFARGEVGLVAGLMAASAAVLAFVFVGMPAASGGLARATPPTLERQIGDNFEAQLLLGMKPCNGQAGQAALSALGARLGSSAGGPFDIRVQAVQAPFSNAFALPGGAVLVTDDLIEMAKTPDELAAVLAHEVAHVRERHVMQAVWRSLGLGLVLDAVVGGGTGAGQQAVLLAGSMTDLSYTRAAETEADAIGREILHELGLSSEGMAPFFERMAARGEGAEAASVKELISSHPDSRRRARVSRESERPGASALSAAEWALVKAACPAPKAFGLRDKVADVLSKSE